MQFYPLNTPIFANISVTASYAVTSSFIAGLVPSATQTLIPSGSQGNPGTSGGTLYYLSSALLVCAGVTTTTTSTTTTTTTSTTTTTTAAPPTTTTTTTSTTSTTTEAPICETVGNVCNPQQINPLPCGRGCECRELSPGYGVCQSIEPF